MGHVTEVSASSFLDIIGTTGDSSSFWTSPYTLNQVLTSTALFEFGAPGSDKVITSFGDADTPVWLWAAANNEWQWTAGLEGWSLGCQPLLFLLECTWATVKIPGVEDYTVRVRGLNFGSSNLCMPECAPTSPKQNPPSPCRIFKAQFQQQVCKIYYQSFQCEKVKVPSQTGKSA